MADVLVQTRIPSEIAERVQAVASIRGESIAGWLRRTVIKETTMNRIGAWMVHRGQADPSVMLNQYNRREPSYFVEPVRDLGPLHRVFHLYGRDAVSPITREEWQESQGFKQPHEQRFMLDGSPHVWSIGSASFDSATGLLDLTLQLGPIPGAASQGFRSFAEATARYQELRASYQRVQTATVPDQQHASLTLGSVQAAVTVHKDERDEIVVPRLVAMLERGLGLQ